MAATATAFGLPELLEDILLHLPLKDLLLAQGVCKGWRDLIQDSKKARMALYLEPCSTTRLFGDPNTFTWRETATRNTPKHKPIINPLLSKQIKYRAEIMCVEVVHDGFINPTNPVSLKEAMAAEQTSLHNAAASWRKTLLLQPSAERTHFLCTESVQRDDDIFFSALSPVEYRAAVSEWETHLRRQRMRALRARRRSAEGGDEDSVTGSQPADPKPAKPQNVGLTLGAFVDQIRKHCHICPNCPYTGGLENRWVVIGDTETDVVDANISGWELLAELARRGWCTF
jgi:hypothetical protein